MAVVEHAEFELRSAVGRRRGQTFWTRCKTCGAEGPTQTSAGLAHAWRERHQAEVALAEAGVVAFCACGLVAGHYGPCRV